MYLCMKFIIQAGNLPFPLWLNRVNWSVKNWGIPGSAVPYFSSRCIYLLLTHNLFFSFFNVNRCTMFVYLKVRTTFLSLITDFFRHLSFCFKKWFFYPPPKSFVWMIKFLIFLCRGFCFIHGYCRFLFFHYVVRDAST